MSLHPLNVEMMVGEVALVSGAGGGGVVLWNAEHPWLAIGAWALAALVLSVIVMTAIVERATYPPRQVFGNFAIAMAATAYLGAVGWGAYALHQADHDGLALLAVIAGLWGGPIALAVLSDYFSCKG
jgi:hypothetical protein